VPILDARIALARELLAISDSAATESLVQLLFISVSTEWIPCHPGMKGEQS